MKKILLLLSLIMSCTFAREKLTEIEKVKIIELLKVNDQLHMAFFKYNKDEIDIISKNVIEKINSLPKNKKYTELNKSITSLAKIPSTSLREENYEFYHKFSLPLFYFILKYDVGDSYNGYSCPMVKKKWVQNSSVIKRVHNPFAPEMPHCGQRDSDF